VEVNNSVKHSKYYFSAKNTAVESFIVQARVKMDSPTEIWIRQIQV